MHLFAFRVTKGSSVKSFEMYSEIEVFPFYFPRLIFTDAMSVFRQMSCVCTPIIGKIEVDENIFKVLKQLPEISISSISVVPGQNDTRGFVYSIPSPSPSLRTIFTVTVLL